MQDINGNLISKWNNNYSKLEKHILNGKRTIQQAKFYMEENYIDSCSSTKAFKYLMYVHPQDSILETKLYILICDAIKLGYGKDYNFENCFR